MMNLKDTFNLKDGQLIAAMPNATPMTQVPAPDMAGNVHMHAVVNRVGGGYKFETDTHVVIEDADGMMIALARDAWTFIVPPSDETGN